MHITARYKPLVIKFETADVLFDSFLDSRNVTFFENIFPLKVAYSPSSSSFNFTSEPIPMIKSFEYPHKIEKDDSEEAPRRSKR